MTSNAGSRDDQQRGEQNGAEDVDVAQRVARQSTARQRQITAQALRRKPVRHLVQQDRRQQRDRPFDEHVED